MKENIEAACGCHLGRIRKNNEDNFYFNGEHLAAEHTAKAAYRILRRKDMRIEQFAVFDGMGGENFGELASYAAAKEMSAQKMRWNQLFAPLETTLYKQVICLNQAVLKAKTKMQTSRMGTTMVSLVFKHRMVYVCNIGDSRAYRLRDGPLSQLSVDHVDARPGRPGRKPLLTQHLGIDPEDMVIEPHIVKNPYRAGDKYLLCSDGLTDMLTDSEISDIMEHNENPEVCVNELIDTALLHGGRDNITVVICKVV